MSARDVTATPSVLVRGFTDVCGARNLRVRAARISVELLRVKAGRYAERPLVVDQVTALADWLLGPGPASVAVTVTPPPIPAAEMGQAVVDAVEDYKRQWSQEGGR